MTDFVDFLATLSNMPEDEARLLMSRFVEFVNSEKGAAPPGNGAQAQAQAQANLDAEYRQRCEAIPPGEAGIDARHQLKRELRLRGWVEPPPPATGLQRQQADLIEWQRQHTAQIPEPTPDEISTQADLMSRYRSESSQLAEGEAGVRARVNLKIQYRKLGLKGI